MDDESFNFEASQFIFSTQSFVHTLTFTFVVNEMTEFISGLTTRHSHRARLAEDVSSRLDGGHRRRVVAHGYRVRATEGAAIELPLPCVSVGQRGSPMACLSGRQQIVADRRRG